MPTPARSNSPGNFTDPTTLAEFNQRLANLGLPGPLTPQEHRLLLEQRAKADVLRALIHIHNGTNNPTNARAFITKAVNEVRQVISEGSGPRSDSEHFVVPENLGMFNALISRLELCRPVSKAELDVLLQTVGRSELVSALRDVHGQTADAPAAEALLRRELATAIVKVARGEGASNQPSDSDLPPESSDDTGFSGMNHSHRSSGSAPRQATDSRAGQRPPASSTARAAHSRPHGAQQRQMQSAPNDNEVRNERADRFQARAYGKRAALCVEQVDDGSQGATLMVEMAPAIEGRAKEYNWKEGKIRFQLMHKELIMLIALLYGWIESVEFANHGETKVKTLSLALQDGGKLFMKLTDKNVPMLVLPVTEVDSQLTFTSQALAQACKVFRMDSSALLLWVRQRVPTMTRAVPQGQRSSTNN